MSVCGTVDHGLKLSGFSWKLGINHFGTLVPRHRISGYDFPDLPKKSPYMLKPPIPTDGWPNLLRPHIASTIGTGILTCFPSTTLFSLALGADSPYADERCVGNLGLSASGPFTRFIATHVSIRTSDTSSIPLETPSTAYGTLPYHIFRYPQLRCTV